MVLLADLTHLTPAQADTASTQTDAGAAADIGKSVRKRRVQEAQDRCAGARRQIPRRMGGVSIEMQGAILLVCSSVAKVGY